MPASTRPHPQFYAIMVIVGFATFVIHEAAHWAVGEALGYRMVARLNGAFATVPTSVGHAIAISAAGPAITIVQGVLALVLVLRRHSMVAYAFLFWAAFMRFMAMIVSLLNPNDEARISLWLGWGQWTLPFVVTTGLIFLTWRGSGHLGLSWKTNVLAYAVASATVGVIVGLDMAMATG